MKLKRFLSILLVCLMTVSTIGVASYAGNDPVKNMLHVTGTKKNTNYLQKTANLVNGETYTASFQYKDVSDQFDKNYWFYISKAQKVVEDVDGKGKKFFDGRETNTFLKIEEGTDGWRTLSYTFVFVDHDNVDIPDGTVKTDIGFMISSLASDFYFADMTVYKTSDAEKTNLLLFPTDDNGLYGWHRNYEMAANGATTFSSTAYTVECVEYDESLFVADAIGNYMLHVTAVGGSTKPLQKTAELTKGKTYVATFKYKQVSGVLDKDFYFRVTKPQQVVENVSDKGKVYFDSHLDQFDSVNPVSGVLQLEYIFTLTDRDGITFENGTTKYDIGFCFESGKTSNIYVADFAVYEANDTTKKNLLLVPGYSEGLYGWHSDYYAAGNGAKTFETSAYTAEYVMYDESMFKHIPSSHNMLHVVTTGENAGVLQKTANLVNGKTYTVSFQYKDASRQLNNRFWFVVTKAQQIVEKAADQGTKYFDGRYEDTFLKIEEGTDGWRTLSYTFLFADHDGVAVPNGTVKTSIGFAISNYEAEFYFADMTIYEADDSDKTNLLLVPTDNNGLNGWHRNYAMAEDGSTVFTSAAYTVECLSYDEDLFKILPGSHHMLHVVTTGEKSGVLQKTANLVKGKTYTVSFQYKAVSGQLNSRFWFVITKAQQIVENVEGKGKKFFDGRDEDGFVQIKDDDPDWNTISYTFLFDDHDDIMIPNGTVKTDIGLTFPNYTAELYFADMTIYEASDPDKTNLLLVPTDDNGLNGWHRDYAMAEDGASTFTSAAYTVECLPYDESMFFKEKPIEYPEQICYFQNGPSWGAFASSAKVTVGKTYYFEYSVASISRVVLYAATTGKRESILGGEQEIERKEYDDYYHVVYAITIPEKSNKGTPMTSYAFVGINIPAGVGGYIFDIHLYDPEDPTKKDLLPNPGFKKGLDDFVFDWAAWFTDERDGLGLREWKNDTKTLSLFDYDLKKIVQYTDDSKFNDGEWWNPKDLAVDSDLGIARLKGTLKNYNNGIFVNTKLLLSSNDKEYFTKTNAKGCFEFPNISPSFYELFTVDEKGEKYATGFFTNIADGEEYSLDIICESDQENTGLPTDNTVFEEQKDSLKEEAKGSVKGNLYTPDRKPVKNCKIYMRNIGEIVTDEDGYFEFSDVPLGTYDIYAISTNRSEMILKTVTIKENIELRLKLKYETAATDAAGEKNTSVWIYLGIIGATVLVMIGGSLFVLFKLKRKKRA